MFKKLELDNCESCQKAICTSGIEYCYVSAMNKIYKCNAHYSDHLHEKSYDLKDYKDFFEKETELCDHVSCLDRECDVYLVEVWDLEGKRINPRKIFWRDYCKNIEEVKKQKNFHIQFEPVFGCSHKCPYCALTQSEATNPMHFIDMSMFLKMADHIVKNFAGIKQFNIAGGGEPLLHSEINNLFNYCHNNDVEMFLVTSGLVNNSKYFNIADILKNISVSLSLHPLSPYWKESKVRELIRFLSEHAKYLDCRLVMYEDNIQYLDLVKDMIGPYGIKLIEMPYIDNLEITKQFNNNDN